LWPNSANEAQPFPADFKGADVIFSLQQASVNCRNLTALGRVFLRHRTADQKLPGGVYLPLSEIHAQAASRADCQLCAGVGGADGDPRSLTQNRSGLQPLPQ
jgi:hypothetical protein